MRSGRPPASSTEERKRVYELTDAGSSSRRVAEAVWGDAGLKNRVLRLLQRREATGLPSEPGEDDFEELMARLRTRVDLEQATQRARRLT